MAVCSENPSDQVNGNGERHVEELSQIQRVGLKSQGNIYTLKPFGSDHLLIGLLQRKVMALNVTATNMKPFELHAISKSLPPVAEIISLEVFKLDGHFVVGKPAGFFQRGSNGKYVKWKIEF